MAYCGMLVATYLVDVASRFLSEKRDFLTSDPQVGTMFVQLTMRCVLFGFYEVF